FQVPEHWQMMLEPNAGFLLPEKVIAAYAEQALRIGADIHAREPVVEWSSDGAGVKVQTARDTYRAGHVIFCAGAWSARLLADLGVKLTVTRQVMGWVWPRQPQSYALGVLPVWAIGNRDGSLYYGFPMMSDNPGVKVAFHSPGLPTDPDRVNREVLAEDEQTFRPALARFLPTANGPLLALRTC